ncbi:hypothetical protein, partial [Xanthomonas graminis]
SAAAEGNPVSQKQQQSNSSRATARAEQRLDQHQEQEERAVWRLELVQPIAGLIQHEQKPNDAMKPLAEAIRVWQALD